MNRQPPYYILPDTTPRQMPYALRYIGNLLGFMLFVSGIIIGIMCFITIVLSFISWSNLFPIVNYGIHTVGFYFIARMIFLMIFISGLFYANENTD